MVFGRFGRSDAEGAFATCHCLTLPESEPGYYFWRDRATGELTRRSEWFVTKSPRCGSAARAIKYLHLVRAAALLRSDARAIPQGGALSGRHARLGREARHDRARALSHRSRRDRASAASRMPTARDSPRSHGPQVLRRGRRDGAAAIWRRSPIPALYEFLSDDFAALTRALRRRGGDDVQEFPVVPAALHGAGATCRRSDRAS